MDVEHVHYATQSHGGDSATLFCTCGASFYWINPVSAERSLAQWKAGLVKARNEGQERMGEHIRANTTPDPPLPKRKAHHSEPHYNDQGGCECECNYCTTWLPPDDRWGTWHALCICRRCNESCRIMGRIGDYEGVLRDKAETMMA